MNLNTTSNLSSRAIIVIITVGIAIIIGGLLIGQATPLIFPPQASAESTQIDNLFHIMLVIGGAIFLLVQGLLIYSIWRFRAKPDDTGDGIPLHGNTTLEIVWTAIPSVIVFILTILSYQVWVSLQTPKNDELVIKVDGQRFNWNFSYEAPHPKKSGEKVVVKEAQLHTYVGRPVLLEMNGQDVIHAFWVPAFRLKQDLIPGRVTQVRFTPTAEGTYPIRCAELCGSNHGMMITDVVVYKTETEFKTWLDKRVDEEINPPPDPVARGERILKGNVYPCNTCHVQTNLGWAPAAPVGPSLNNIGDRAAGPRAAVTGQTAEQYLTTAVHEPGAYLAPGYGPLMPKLSFNESVCEVESIVAYLCTQTASGAPVCTIKLPDRCLAADASAEATAQPGAESTAQPNAPQAEGTAEATTQAVVPGAEATQEATPAQ